MKNTLIRRQHSIASAFVFAINGLTYALQTERNFRIQLVIIAAALASATWLRLPAMHFVAIIFASALVLSLELLNTAIERTIDLISPGPNPLAGLIKDVSAGAVLVASLAASLIGLIIFIPAFIQYVN